VVVVVVVGRRDAYPALRVVLIHLRPPHEGSQVVERKGGRDRDDSSTQRRMQRVDVLLVVWWW